MADIFISYAHKDQPRANIIAQTLQAMGWSIWQDVHNLRAMESFTAEIEEGIRKCSIFLMLYSKAYSASAYCSKEFQYAIETHQKNEACIILDDDCPWNNSRFGFHYAGRTIPGYGKYSETEEELHALCEQITNSVVFVALKALRSSGSQSVLPPVPFGDRPKLRLRNSFEIAARQLGQYRQNHSYEKSLALRFMWDVPSAEYDDDEAGERRVQTPQEPMELGAITSLHASSRIVISGSGGLGKTTAMLEYGRSLLDSQPVIYIHLPDVRFGRQDGGTQYNHIERFIYDRICVNDDTWNYVQEVAQRVDGEGLHVTILLDGINELHSSHMKEAVNEIADLSARWKYTNLIVSTRNAAGLRSTRLNDFDFYTAEPPSGNQVSEYLRKNGIAPENLSARVLDLLRNPLRLTIYVQTQPNYDYYRKMPGIHALLHRQQDTAGKIMDNYLASQLYHFLDACETDEARMPQISAYVLSEIVVPYMAWNAYQEDRFSISESEFRKTMRGLQDQLPDLWADYSDRRLEDLIDDFGFREDYTWRYRDAVGVMEILNLLPLIETAEGERAYVFPHQSFRDYYAARFLAADLQLHLRSKHSYRGERTLTLSEAELTDDILELLSDILQEERAKPICDETAGWQFPGKKPDSREPSSYSCAERALCFLRDRFDEPARTAVRNLMSVLRYARDGRLAMCCFDRLDFSKCSLRHGMFSLWFRDQLCTSTFDGAYMNSNAFFCQAHLNYVRAVCAGPEGRLLSGDMDGALLETDIAEGTVTGKWLLPEKNIRAIAWNGPAQQAAVITGHSLYLFDRKTESFRLLMHHEQQLLQSVRFGSNGEAEYSVDTYPMVWFRPDGSCCGMENRPPWLSGAYAVNRDGSRYWRSCLNKHLFTGTRADDGQWNEQGGSISEIYTPHISNCVRLLSVLTELDNRFPKSPKARQSHRHICEMNVWSQLAPDPIIQAFQSELRHYLFLDEHTQDNQFISQSAAALEKKARALLSEIPTLSGKRISCIALSPAQDYIIVACGNIVMELDANTLKLRRRLELGSTVSSVCYLEDVSGAAYAAIGWAVNVSVVNQEFKIVSTCYGQIPTRKLYSYYDSQRNFYLLCSDGILRKLNPERRVIRTRTIPRSSISRYFDSGNGLQIAYPMIMSRWNSGERYEYETDASYPLKDQYYRPEQTDKTVSLGGSAGHHTVYFLDKAMQVVSPDSRTLKEIKYASGLCIFGCSFRDLRGGLTADERETLYMNGGEFH